MYPPIYIVNFKNPERKQRMLNRFRHFGIEPKFVNEVECTDPRLVDFSIDKGTKRIWAIMVQHLDCIRDFYENSEDTHCIVCEDDIHISKNFDKLLPRTIETFNKLNLDVLMLGYLLPFKIDKHSNYYPIMYDDNDLSYHRYHDDTWGTQMYLISRKYAKFLLDKYTIEYAWNNLGTFNYSPDWVMTKNGEKSMVYPMLAVEEGVNVSDDYYQNLFHTNCHKTNFDPELYF